MVQFNKERFYREPVHNKEYLKTKIKSYDCKVNTNIYENKTPNKTVYYVCMSTLLMDFVFKTGQYYYPQITLEEGKYTIKSNKIRNFIVEDIEVSSNQTDEELSDEDVSVRKVSDEEQMKTDKIFAEQLIVSLSQIRRVLVMRIFIKFFKMINSA